MGKNRASVLLISLMLAFGATVLQWFDAQAAAPANIRVGLMQNSFKATFAVEGPYRLIDSSTNREITTLKSGDSWQATALGNTTPYVKGPDGSVQPLSGGQFYAVGSANQSVKLGTVFSLMNNDGVLSSGRGGIQLSKNGNLVGAYNGPVVIKEVAHQDGNLVRVGDIRYRGDMEIRLVGSGLTVINKLPLEEYLYGVVPKEMPSSWPKEALKAQAVAARNYALEQMGRYESAGFDVVPTDLCQVYGGYSAEKASSNAAVSETRGQVMVYNGQTITAFFHSSSGGFTENSEEVWSNPIPYLRTRVDLLDENPVHYNWQKSFTLDELKNQLANSRRIYFSSITDLVIEKMTTSGNRIQILQVIGTDPSGQPKTTRLYNADTVRTAFGLKSGPKSMDKEVDPLNKITKVTFSGSGWGHGLGMSQYGASGMARNGNNYLQILQHYYTGTNLVDNYNN